MRSLKLTAIALLLGVAGAVYAAGPKSTPAQTASDANASCCKMHKQGGTQTAAEHQACCAHKDGATCCCCAAGSCSTKLKKVHAARAAAHTVENAAAQTSANATAHAACCADGADCCANCACCQAQHAHKSTTNADTRGAKAEGTHAGCACCARRAGHTTQSGGH
jgi:hypothetical protein